MEKPLRVIGVNDKFTRRRNIQQATRRTVSMGCHIPLECGERPRAYVLLRCARKRYAAFMWPHLVPWHDWNRTCYEN